MSREKLLHLFFACLLLSFLIWPYLSYSSDLYTALHLKLKNFSLINSATDSMDTIPVINTKEDSTSIFLKHIISQAGKLWDTDRGKADSLIKSGFKMIDSNTTNDTIIAEAYHSLGKLLVDKNETEAGIDTLLRCIRIKKNAFGNNSPYLSKTYNYIGIGYYNLREYDSATKYYTYSIKQKRLNGLVDEDFFDAYLNLGVLNATYGKYSKAYRFLDSVNYLIDSIKPPIDSLRIAFFYYNYGALATTNGKLKEANEFYNIAEAIILTKLDPKDPFLAGFYTNKGVNSMYDLNFSQALLFYKNALEINQYNDQFKTKVPMSYANLSMAAIELKDYSGAVNYCREGLKYNPSGEIQLGLLINLAQSLSKLGHYDEANTNYLKALKLALNENVNPRERISLNIRYADFLIKTNEFTDSKYYYQYALDQASKHFGKNSLARADLLSKLGNYFFKYEYNFDSSAYYYNKSIAIWKNLLLLENDSVFYDVKNDNRFIDAYAGKAALLFGLYKEYQDTSLLAESSRLLTIVLDRADLITKNLDNQSSYLLLELVKPIYELAIEVSYEKYIRSNNEYDLIQAFEYAERSKSSVLLSSIQNNNALKTTEVPIEIVEDDHQIQSEINGLRKLLADEENKPNKSSQKISFYNSRLLELMIRHDSLVSEIEKQHPKYYALKYDRSVIDVNKVQEKLLDDEILLEYVLTDSSLLIFSIGKEIAELDKMEIDSNFMNALQYLINIKNVDLTHQHNEDFKKYIRSSQILWKSLIEPVYKNLDGKRLIIIPDGLLGYLSFDLLLKPSEEIPTNLIYKTLPFLLKEFPISYAYSSSLKYNEYFKKESIANQNFIGFAPVYSAKTDSDLFVTENLKPLPGAMSEVLDAKAIFGGEAYLNNKATKTNFLRNASTYKIIHLAMHTLINDSLPMFSELVFSNSGLDSNDQKLFTYEIYGLNLEADMVTLSACNTGTGKLQHGEGIMSLSRGFVYAGVPSIVMTLWDVQDNSSSEIMKQYYTYLHQGLPKDIALQKAKLEFLDGSNMLKAHPYYWSAYIITGDSSPIIAKPKQHRLELLTGLGIFILVITVVFIKAKSAKTS